MEREIIDDCGRSRFSPYEQKSPEELVKLKVVDIHRVACRLLYTVLHETPYSKIWYKDSEKVNELVDSLHVALIELDYSVATLSELEGSR